MFKLISLSSPTGLFKKIIFKDGLNIILGRYSKSGKDINGIGKTTIINLIDYCLLADGVKSELFKEKYNFIKNELVKLEFVIGETKYSIERGFEDKRKVFFSRDEAKPTEFLDTDLRLILGSEIGKGQSGIYEPIWFRTLMSFFVQNDHSFSQRDAANPLKFTVGKRQPELFCYIFSLLGIDNSQIWDFDNDTVELKSLRSDQTRINKQIVEQTGKTVDDFRGECESVARKVDKLEVGLDNYTFDENVANLEEKLKTLSGEISTLNKQHMTLVSKHRDVEESLLIDVDVNPEEVSNFYSEIHSEFSKFIMKSLSEVIEFRQEISTNRRKFLKVREAHYKARLDELKNKLISLERERSKVFNMLDEKSAFDSLKSAYNNLVEEKARLSGQLTYIEQLDHIEEAIARKKFNVSSTVARLVANKNEYLQVVDEVKEIFIDLVEGSVDIDSSDVSPYFNIEFKSNQKSPIKLSLEVPRGSSLGKGRFKILAFDLTVFITSILRKSNFPSFLVHDGVFHAIAHKTRINFLNYINAKLDELDDIQYIITVNEDEIIFPESEGVTADLDFNLEEKTLITLEDNPGHMFLGKEFG
jgi:uncharacterized protein YydD (DUF2326 family)